MHTFCKGNMNQRNSRLYLILSATFLFSGNSYSPQKNETTTSMIHATQSAPTENDIFIPSSAATTRQDLSTSNCLTLQESKQATSTISQNTSATKVLGNALKKNTPSIKTASEHLRNRSENSVYKLISSPAPTTFTKTRSESRNVILIIVLPILGLTLTGLVIAFLINHTHGKKQLLSNEADSENPASPIFEEDVASVMEVEMDELDRWMGSMKKNSQQGLPDISEDKEPKPESSDPES